MLDTSKVSGNHKNPSVDASSSEVVVKSSNVKDKVPHDESDDLLVCLYHFEGDVGVSVPWNQYMNKQLLTQGKWFEGFAPVWFCEDPSEGDDIFQVIKVGDTVPIRAIVDFPVMLFNFEQNMPEVEYIQYHLTQNLKTKGKHMNGYVIVTGGKDGLECSNRFNEMLKDYPDYFEGDAA